MVIPLAVRGGVERPFTDAELKSHEQKAREHVATLLGNGMTAGSIAINNRCNLACEHCYILDPERKDDKPSANYRAIPSEWFNGITASEIAQDFRNASTLFLSIPTMEPLLTRESRSASFAAIKAFVSDEDIKKGRIRGMSLITNATLMHKLSGQQVFELAKRVEFLSVSLEGGRTIHDKIRGEGNFNKTVEGIRNLVRRGYDSRKICLQSTIQPSVNKAYKQAIDILEATKWVGTGKASFTARINPRLTFTSDRSDVKYHVKVFLEVLRACSDAERKGIHDKLITIYGTYESPAAVIALNRIIRDSGASQKDIKYNAFETSYYLKHPDFKKLDVRLEVAPHPVEIPGYPRIAIAKDPKKYINITDMKKQPHRGAGITSCFGYQTDEKIWAHWMPGLIPYLDREMQRRGKELAHNLELPKQNKNLSVDPNIPRTKEKYFEEVLITGVQRQLLRTAFLCATYKKLNSS